MAYIENPTVQILLYILAGIVGMLLILIGYRLGRWAGGRAAARLIASREQELFTAQRGFKNLYEREVATLKEDNAALQERVQHLEQRVEEYRKKAAGFGTFFSRGRRAEAMYTLLLENEALEEALYSQNDKLRQERLEALKEQQRATNYRRVLISQLLSDERVKGYVAEVLSDEKRLPPVEPPAAAQALPEKPAER